MDIKFKIISGVATILAASSLYMFYRDRKKSLNQKLIEQMEKLRDFMNQHFEDCPKEQLSTRIEDRKELFGFINDMISNFSDIGRVNEEIIRHPYFKKLDLQNEQIQLFNQEYTTLYLRRNSLDAVFQYIQQITTKNVISQEEPQLSENTSKFITFFYVFFIDFVKFIEEVMLNPGDKHGLIQMNFMLSGILDIIEQILKQYPQLANLIGIALMGQLQLNEPHIQFGHKCADNFDAKIDVDSQTDCKCLIIDAIIRYISLITPTLQKKFITIIVDYGVLQSKEHLVKLGQVLLTNVFFMNSQINQESMYYVADVSVLNHLLIQTTAHAEVRRELAQPDLLDNYFLYLERVLAQNQPKFIAKILPSIIASHVMMYPLFGDAQSLQNLIRDEKSQTITTVHFLGVLLVLETKDTVDVNQNQQMLDWLAQNMDYMLSIEVLTFLQKQFLQQIYKVGNKELLMKQFLQCLRVTHNKRIQNKQQQKRQFEITSCLQSMLGYLIAMQITESPNKNTLQKIINIIPFQDANEATNIFSNVLRIIFDLPTINFHFLKFVQPKCEKISQESQLSYQGYYTHILTAQTVSYDSYMFSLQLSFLYGKPEAMLNDVLLRMKNDFKDFERYEEFLIRDIILLVDVIENPYYLMNIIMQCGVDFPNKKQIEKQLFQYATITILKLNEGINRKQLLASLSMFVHLQTIPDYIVELFEESPNGELKLRHQYSLNYPYLSLQKDMGSVLYFLEKCDQPFDELMYAPESFEFLFEIRQQLFQCESFCNIINLCLKSQDRMKIQVWIGKMLYYAKQCLLKRGGKQIEVLLQSDECQSFIKELGYEKLVQYLQQ